MVSGWLGEFESVGKKGGEIFSVGGGEVGSVKESGSGDHAIDSQFSGSSGQMKEAGSFRTFVFAEGNDLVEKRSNHFGLGRGYGSAKKLVPTDPRGGEELALLDPGEDFSNFVTPEDEGSDEVVRIEADHELRQASRSRVTSERYELAASGVRPRPWA